MMRLLEQSHKIETRATDQLIATIERASRACYKPEHKIEPDSTHRFVQKLISMGYEFVLEHGTITVRLLTDRAVSHELVQHHLVSYSQESQRYTDLKHKGLIEFIRPWWISKDFVGDYENREAVSALQLIHATDQLFSTRQIAHLFLSHLMDCHDKYQLFRNFGCTPQQACAVLPNAIKTETVMTANLKEWRHILKLRTSNAAHPQIRELMIPILRAFKRLWPALFEDIGIKQEEGEDTYQKDISYEPNWPWR